MNFSRRSLLLQSACMATALAMPLRALAYEVAVIEGSVEIKGHLHFTGDVPAVDEISISKDNHICGHGIAIPDALELIGNGRVGNGIVGLRNVTAGKPWEAELTSPRIVQKDCEFRPFVQIAPRGAVLTIENIDPLLHNIHAYEQIGRARRTMFNIAQPAAGQVDSVTLKMRRGTVVEVDCDAHNWMSAWIYTAVHPYFSVTGSDGGFTLSEVPPGSYELVMWHPVLGEKTREINVQAGLDLDFNLDMNA